MARVAKFIADDLKSVDFRLRSLRSDVGRLLGLRHRCFGVFIVVLNPRSLSGACGARIMDLVCHMNEPARATMVSAAVPIVQGRLDRGARSGVEDTI